MHTIIIPANKRDEYNEACRRVGLADEESAFFSLPLYQGNSKVPSHYAAVCPIDLQRLKSLAKVVSKEQQAITKLDRNQPTAEAFAKCVKDKGAKTKPDDKGN